MQGKWERQTGRHQNGEDYKLGSITVGSAFYDGLVSINEPRKYTNVILLPGIRTSKLRFLSIDEAKVSLEHLVKAWFAMVRT